MRQHGAEELGRDLEVAIRLELGRAGRTDMMQHENGADACEDWSQQNMRAGKIKRTQAGADDVVAELLHQEWLAGASWLEING